MISAVLVVAPSTAFAQEDRKTIEREVISLTVPARANEYVAARASKTGGMTPATPLNDADCALLIQMTGTVKDGLGTFEVLDPATAEPTRTYSASEKVQYVVLPGGCAQSLAVDSTMRAQPWNPETGTGGVVFLGGETLTLNAQINADSAGFASSHSVGAGCDGTDGDANNGNEWEGGGGGGGIFGGGGGAGGHAGDPGGWSATTDFNDALPGDGGTVKAGGLGGLSGNGRGPAGDGGAPGCVGNGGDNSSAEGGYAGFWRVGAGGGGGGSYGGGGGGCSAMSSGAYSTGGSGGGSYTGGGVGGAGGTNTGFPLSPENELYNQPDGSAGNTPSAASISTANHYFRHDDARVMMGGAGGSSWAAVAGPLDGGRGGGIVVLAFDSITGSSTISANGGKGVTPDNSDGGGSYGSSGSGGGAGGQVVLFSPSVSNVHIAANGGVGGPAVLDTSPSATQVGHTGSRGASGGGGGIWFAAAGSEASNSGTNAGATSKDAPLIATGLTAVTYELHGGDPLLESEEPTVRVGGAVYSATDWADLVNAAGAVSRAGMWMVTALVLQSGNAFTEAELEAAFPIYGQPNNPKNLGIGCTPGSGGTGLALASTPPAPTLEVETLINGVVAGEVPQRLVVGQKVALTYAVSVKGVGSITNISVRDKQLGAIKCPASEVAAGETMNCVATTTAQLGEYASSATVQGLAGSEVATVSKALAYTGVTASLAMTATVNGVQVEKDPALNQIPLDAKLAWEFTVTNNGEAPIKQLLIQDVVSVANTQPGAESISCNWDASTDPETEAGLLGAGEVVRCAAVGIAGDGAFLSTATATAVPVGDDGTGTLVPLTDIDDVPLSLSASAVTGYVGFPTYDLALASVVENTTSTLKGTQVTYALTVKNQGHLPSDQFAITSQLAAGTRFVSATDGGAELAKGSGVVQWTFDGVDENNLAPGASRTVTLVVNVGDLSAAPFTAISEISLDSGDDDDSTPDATLDNDNLVDITDVASLDTDTNSNDPDEDDHDVASWNPDYDLALAALLVDTEVTRADTTLTYEITVRNQGDVVSGSFVVTNLLPEGTSFVSASNEGAETAPDSGLVEWTVEAAEGVRPGESRTFTLVAEVDDLSATPFTNAAEISADTGVDDDSTPNAIFDDDNLVDVLTIDGLEVDAGSNDPDEDDHDIALWAPYDLGLGNEVVAVDSAVAPTKATYEITVQNRGELASGQFLVTNSLAPGTRFVSASNGGAETELGSGVVVWDIAAGEGVLPGESTKLSLVVQVEDPAQAPFVATAELTPAAGDEYNANTTPLPLLSGNPPMTLRLRTWSRASAKTVSRSPTKFP